MSGQSGGGLIPWLKFLHARLAGVTPDQHHPQSHSHDGDGSGTIAHSDTTGRGADDHHAQAHAHSTHSGIGADDHHPQAHSYDSHSDTPTDKTAAALKYVRVNAGETAHEYVFIDYSEIQNPPPPVDDNRKLDLMGF